MVKFSKSSDSRYWVKRILRYMDEVLAGKHERLTREKVGQILEPIYHERSKEMSQTFFGETEARGEAKAIVIILRTKFGGVPQEVSGRVLKIGDLLVLDSLTQLAATCESLDAFVEGLP